jgi:hypothetical protein
MAHFLKPPGNRPEGYDADNKLGPGSLWRVRIPSGTPRTVALYGGPGLKVTSNNPSVVPNNGPGRDRLKELPSSGDLRIFELVGGIAGGSFIEVRSDDAANNFWIRIQALVTPSRSIASEVPDLLRSQPPEGQLDATACWAACYAWWLRVTPGQSATSQLIILGSGASINVVLPNGTLDLNGAMRFFSSRHIGMRSSQINPGELKGLLSQSKLPDFPILIGYASSIMGGHMNVIHSIDTDKYLVSVMDPWFPDPSSNPNYELVNAFGAPMFANKKDGSPFTFKGTHVTRPIGYYESQPLNGRLLIFPDPR